MQSYEQKSLIYKNFFGAYFQWKDRKGLWCAPLFISALLYTVTSTVVYFNTGYWPELDYMPLNGILIYLMWANLILSGVRLAERIGLVNEVYGLRVASLVPVRWILGNFINNAASFNAIYQWSISKIKGEMPKWSKTDHIIPIGFGVENLKFATEVLIEMPTPVGDTSHAKMQAF